MRCQIKQELGSFQILNDFFLLFIQIMVGTKHSNLLRRPIWSLCTCSSRKHFTEILWYLKSVISQSVYLDISALVNCLRDAEVAVSSGRVGCACRQSHLPKLPGAPRGAWKPGATGSSEGTGEQSQWGKFVKFDIKE